MANILCLSSQVARGHVGNSAAVFTAQRLGHDVMALPTTLLSHHPGHGKPAVQVTDPGFLEAALSSLEEKGWLANCDAVLTGYFAHPEQLDIAASFIARRRKEAAANKRPFLYLCDPILGDEDTGLYVPENIASGMRALSALADILTPNPFELSHLAGLPCKDMAQTRAAARALKTPYVLATSAPPPGSGLAASMLVSPSHTWRCSTPFIEEVPKGTGDLISALFLSHFLETNEPTRALALASDAAAAIIAASRGADELRLIAHQEVLRPKTPRFELEELQP